jgi:hypothetical protein
MSFRIFAITVMVREEEEGGHIRGRNIIISSEQGSGKGRVIIKNVFNGFFRFIKYIYLF